MIRSGLLALLVGAALVPRAYLACRREVLSTDGVFYLERAKAWQRGDAQTALEGLRLNLYPPILAALGGLGLPGAESARWLSVLASSLVVIPLARLTRRLAGKAAGLAAGLLYAVHPEALEWSAEVGREPLFWLAWLAAPAAGAAMLARPGPRRGLLAGAWWSAAVLLRFEGWLLAGVAVLSVAARGRVRRGLGRRLAVALAAAAAMLPAGLIALNWTAPPGAGWQWGRLDHLALARRAIVAVAGRAASAPAPQAPAAGRLARSQQSAPPHRESWKSLAWGYGHTLVVGVHPACLALAACGLATALRRGRWRRFWPLWLLALADAAAIGLYFIAQRETTARYFVGVGLCLLPTAAVGLVAAAGWLAALAGRFMLAAGRQSAGPRQPPSARQPAASSGRWTARAPGEVARARRWILPVLLAAALIGYLPALRETFGESKASRRQHAALGRYVAGRLGPGRTLMGSENLERLVGYYAQACHRSLPEELSADEVVGWIERHRPEVVVAWLRPPGGRRFARLLTDYAALGYRRIEPAELPPACGDAAVFYRADVHLADRRCGW